MTYQSKLINMSDNMIENVEAYQLMLEEAGIKLSFTATVNLLLSQALNAEETNRAVRLLL